MSFRTSLRLRQLGICAALLLVTCPHARAEGTCSDPAVKDFFIQGGEQVIEGDNVRIRSLSHDETLAESETSLSCRYLMELSNSSRTWVRFSYTLDESGEASIDYEEETAARTER